MSEFSASWGQHDLFVWDAYLTPGSKIKKKLLYSINMLCCNRWYFVKRNGYNLELVFLTQFARLNMAAYSLTLLQLRRVYGLFFWNWAGSATPWLTEYGGSDAAGFEAQGFEGSFHFLWLVIFLEPRLHAVRKRKQSHYKTHTERAVPCLSS